MLPRLRLALKIILPFFLVVCLLVLTYPNAPYHDGKVELYTKGRCSAKDKATLDANYAAVPYAAAHCIKSTLKWLTQVNPEGFYDCFKQTAPISEQCASCYVDIGRYAVANCKFACLKSWCSSGCLECKRKDDANFEACTGYKRDQMPKAEICDKSEAPKVDVQQV
jgi:hypothetical protein